MSQSPGPSLPDDRLCLVDVGGAGGVQDKWLPLADRVMPVLFEPNPEEAARLRDTIARQFASSLVVESALANTVGRRSLNITRYWGCTSMRRPDPAVLSNYRIAPLFEVARTVEVDCTRYDLLHAAGLVPAPDAIKVDVQGFEYEVLLGFGGLLQGCLGIEIETHLYPIYQGQKLLGDMVAFLADFGFVLRGLRPVPSFDGDVVEANAWFTPDIGRWRGLGPAEQAKFSLICETWGLLDYRRIDPAAPHWAIGAP